MLKKITIKGLFDKFDYDIELKKEGITILTGPNGYGKTTILKILYSFAAKSLAFFFQLPFKEIVLTLENNEIRLSKIDDTLEIQYGSEKIVRYKKNEIILKELRRFYPYKQIDENRWLDPRTDTFYTTDEIINKLDPDIQAKYYKKKLPDFVDVYLIREQRLIRKVITNKRRIGVRFYEDEIEENLIDTIEEYAKELSNKIREIFAKASKIGQELDSSFPRRLFNEKGKISEEEFNERYNIIKEKQKSLSMYSLSAAEEESRPSFKEENAKALRVYLNDTEKKLSVFDEISEKLDIFSTILNQREFVYKRLEISPEFGFRFITEDGKKLSLTDLSSGEQQEVVLLYELLFKVSPNTLVLIDEPEISLHVAWQKEFIDDLLRIIKLQKITVITATHSPQIIKDHWDLVVDLWDLSGEVSK